ncbi:MAG: hypothetical protein U0183_31420 [Polyangiaceae bacterium]
MPYRSKPVPYLDPKAIEDARDIAEVARAADERRSGAALVSLGVTGLAVAFVLGLGSLAKPYPRIVCHQVEIRWENAPELPPNRSTSCREVP